LDSVSIVDGDLPSRARRLLSALKKAVAGVLGGGAVNTAGSRPEVQTLESRQLLSATYFVSPSGSDGNAGNISAPFKTIQHAASIAEPGDKVEIRAGTYHETVTPAHSGTASAPIIFEAYNGENVTVSGADPITGWSNYKNDIYEASMPWDLGTGDNQIFVGNQALNEARFPNSSITDPSHPTKETITSLSGSPSSTTIYDSKLNQAAGAWVGAIVHITPGQAWDGQTGVVTKSSPGSITISYIYHSADAVLKKGDTFWLAGKMPALDSAGEWYRDPVSGKLYLWAPNNGSPASQNIEAKHRQYAFDLSSVHNVTIHGVSIFAAAIKTSASSSSIVINGITARYVASDTVAQYGWYSTAADGILLYGTNDVIENSTIQYSTAAAIVLKGSGSIAENNVVKDADYNAINVGSIQVLGSNTTVDHNTITNSGRHGVAIMVPKVKITYNFISDVGLQTTEAGGIYSFGLNAQGSVMAYNVVENIHTAGYGGTALFIDNNSSNWIIHNNVTSNVDYGLKMNFVCNGDDIYNNTLGATKLAVNTNQKGNWDGTTIANNVFLAGTVFTSGAKITGNVYSNTSTKGAGSVKAGASGVSASAEPPPVTTPPAPTPTPPATPPSATTLIKAVNYTAQSGTQGDNFTGVGYADNNDWIAYALNFGTGVTKLTAALATIHSGGSIQIHLGSPTGTLLGTLNVAVTGAWDKYTAQSAAIAKVAGVQTVYLVFKGGTGVANINTLQFS
jgi:hypothetical protein